MGRFDLGHVDPSEGAFDALGKGEEEGKPPAAARFVSRGLTRNRTDKLQVVSGGASAPAENVTAIGNPTTLAPAPRTDAVGAVALKAEPEAKLSPAQQLEVRATPSAQPSAAVKRAEAKAKGYEGEACQECQHFTLVRNGTCLKCDTCGSTTGCS